MSLLEPSLAARFLAQYKQLLSEVAGRPLDGASDFAAARHALYEDDRHRDYPMPSDTYDSQLVEAVRGANYGTFIYAKKYKQGYALKDQHGDWHCVTALTTPLEDLVPEWVLVDTAILPFHGVSLCDGLVVSRNVLIGRNMIHEMIQELKIERRLWSAQIVARREGLL
jgi:hypothetical protein